MGAMFGNLDHAAELEAPSVRAGRFTLKSSKERCKNVRLRNDAVVPVHQGDCHCRKVF